MQRALLVYAMLTAVERCVNLRMNMDPNVRRRRWVALIYVLRTAVEEDVNLRTNMDRNAPSLCTGTNLCKAHGGGQV